MIQKVKTIMFHKSLFKHLIKNQYKKINQCKFKIKEIIKKIKFLKKWKYKKIKNQILKIIVQKIQMQMILKILWICLCNK